MSNSSKAVSIEQPFFLNCTCCLLRYLTQVEVVTGILDTFIVEPFVPHEQSDEYYVCINSNREGEEFLFCHEGGVDVGDVDEKADRLQVRGEMTCVLCAAGGRILIQSR